MLSVSFLYRLIIIVVSVLVISSIYSTFFLAPSTKPIIDENENTLRKSYNTCGVSNSYPNENEETKIGVGLPTTFMQFPWQAYLHIEYRSGSIYNCAGSLIGDRWILTAAHCLNPNRDNDRLREVRISLGMHNYKTVMDGNQRDFYVGSQNFFIHPEYDSATWNADIALIKLQSAITFSKNIRPICLANWNEHDYKGENLIIAGWSSTFNDDWYEFPQVAVLYKMKVTVMSHTKCKNAYSDVTNEMMCTKGNSRGPNGECIIGMADAGSPLIFKRSNGRYRQIGILSSAEDCKENDHLFYTKISSYAPWIKKTMKNSSASHSFSFLASSLVIFNFMINYLKMY